MTHENESTHVEEPDRSGALARLLRGSGAVMLLASAATFLLQRWQHGDDVWKYALLMVQTLVVVAAAFVCGVRVRESRGARTLFALALASLPVHFGVLGGLVYSQFAVDHPSASLSPHVLWVAPSPQAALVTLAVALALLAPIAFVSLLALVRPEAAKLLGLFLGLNALLLIPVRAPNVVGVVFAAAAFLLAQLEAGPFRRSIALRTPEGVIVRSLLVSPVLLLAGRAIWLYDPTFLFGGVCLLTLGLAIFSLAARMGAGTGRVRALQYLGTAIMVPGWLCVALEAARDFHVPRSLEIPFYGLPFAALLAVLSRYARPNGSGYRRAALSVAATTVLWNLYDARTVAAAFMAIVVGLLLLSTGTYRRRISEVSAGAATLLSGLAVQLHHAIDFEKWLNWGGLSALGIALVFLAAFVERHPDRLRTIVRAWSQSREQETH